VTAGVSDAARGLIIEAEQVDRSRRVELLRAAVAASGDDIEARSVALAKLTQDDSRRLRVSG
jgi:hypothetical protein